MKSKCALNLRLVFLLLVGNMAVAMGQNKQNQQELDDTVQQFLNDSQGKWRNLNVPYEDGKVLFDIIIENNYQSALEIGTSTGHSTIWIAWALSKTGGKLVTVEIDKDRQKEAVKNLEKVGLSDLVDFRLGDAHEIVREVEGPFDFVFSDADKSWYVQYFKDVDPKLEKGGCFTAHNVLQNQPGIKEYLDYVKRHSGYTTTINRSSGSGIAISYKK